METVTDFLFLGSKVTVDGDCSHGIRRQLLLGRKATANLDNVLKSKDMTFLIKVHTVKAMIFPVVMYGSESWTVKKAEHQRIDAFELWCWRRLLRVPWTARRDQSWMLFGRTDGEAETPIPWPPDTKNWLIWKDPDAGKDWRWVEKGTADDEMVGWQRVIHNLATEWQQICFFTEVQLIYNVVVISSVQQSDSDIYVCVYFFLFYYFPLWFILGHWM